MTLKLNISRPFISLHEALNGTGYIPTHTYFCGTLKLSRTLGILKNTLGFKQFQNSSNFTKTDVSKKTGSKSLNVYFVDIMDLSDVNLSAIHCRHRIVDDWFDF